LKHEHIRTAVGRGRLDQAEAAFDDLIAGRVATMDEVEAIEALTETASALGNDHRLVPDETREAVRKIIGNAETARDYASAARAMLANLDAWRATLANRGTPRVAADRIRETAADAARAVTDQASVLIEAAGEIARRRPAAVAAGAVATGLAVAGALTGSRKARRKGRKAAAKKRSAIANSGRKTVRAKGRTRKATAGMGRTAKRSARIKPTVKARTARRSPAASRSGAKATRSQRSAAGRSAAPRRSPRKRQSRKRG
jgi:hypothetical protein